jgi:HAMP domain-containing protein
MSISKKLFWSLTVIAIIVFLGIGLSLGVGSIQRLTKSVGQRLHDVAEEKAKAIDRLLRDRVAEARRLAADPQVLILVRAKNIEMGALSESERNATIRREDKLWLDTKRKSPLAHVIDQTPLSQHLRNYVKEQPNAYGEVFITNRWGATVASTKPLSDYDQSDETWWQAGFDGDKGGVFLDDRGIDLSVDALAMGVVVPVMDEELAIGVLKINFRISGILDIVTAHSRKADEWVILARTTGEILSHQPYLNVPRLSERLTSQLTASDQGWWRDMHGDVSVIGSHAPINILIHTRLLPPGAVKGVSGEKWEANSWYVIYTMAEDLALATVDELLLILSILIAILLSTFFGVAVWLSRTISQPLTALQSGTEVVASGDLSHRISSTAMDEIGHLGQAFNRMTTRLQETMASRDELDREVTQRRKAEKALLKLNEELDKRVEERTADLKSATDDLKIFSYAAAHN